MKHTPGHFMNNWTTKDGRTFPVTMLSDEHLNNVILMMRRFGYITTVEAGPMPRAKADRFTWASKPASMKLDMLVTERLRRIEEGTEPLDEQAAAKMQAEHLRYQLKPIDPNAVYDLRPDPTPWGPRPRSFDSGLADEKQYQRDRAVLRRPRTVTRTAYNDDDPYDLPF